MLLASTWNNPLFVPYGKNPSDTHDSENWPFAVGLRVGWLCGTAHTPRSACVVVFLVLRVKSDVSLLHCASVVSRLPWIRIPHLFLHLVFQGMRPTTRSLPRRCSLPIEFTRIRWHARLVDQHGSVHNRRIPLLLYTYVGFVCLGRSWNLGNAYRFVTRLSLL